MTNHIDLFIAEYRELETFLKSTNQISLLIQVNEHYRKIFLFSCASFYEKEITDILKSFINSNTKDERIGKFLERKAIDRQYHTFFDWRQDTNNKSINSFLKLFGDEFKETICKDMQTKSEILEGINAFIEIGRERNNLAHENFLEYEFSKTFEEIEKLHSQAMVFIEYLRSIF